MTEEQMYSLDDVAERLQVSTQTVRRWIKAGQLHAYKPGLEWRIRPSDLDDFLETRSYPKENAPPSQSEEGSGKRRAAELEETAKFCALVGTRFFKSLKDYLNTSDPEALKNGLLEITGAYDWLLGAHQEALSEYQQLSPELSRAFSEARNAFELAGDVTEQWERLGTVPEGPREVRPVRAPRAQELSGTEDVGNTGA
ncbi:MAG: helix-turn-helix domain-containing protein [Actinomycetota bacterium]|nr:helix-turn-helix domain-containing protein [Actinomycetota bacterium]